MATPTDVIDPALDDPLTLDAAVDHVAASALHDTGARRSVGLELEFHLVDLSDPGRRPAWADVMALLAAMPEMPSGSSVTVEPGGQLELSTPPSDDLVTAVESLQGDRRVLRQALLERGFGAAPLGADPAREPTRINPHPRYAAMEDHFASRGCPDPARAMMTATAALQVNLDAGPAEGWVERLERLRALVPLLVAVSSTSPWLGGRRSGWHSMRQETWAGIDHCRSDPVSAGEPRAAWSDYALSAAVMLVREPGDPAAMRPLLRRVSFADWLREPRLVGRPATRADLDYHLSTLFPPVRPRGYVELRCIDAAPDRWWPALAAFAAVLADDPVAADVATEVCAPLADQWDAAARYGLDDDTLHRAALICVEVVVARAPAALKPDVERLAACVEQRRTPGHDLADRIAADGPLAVLEEEARA